MMKKLGENSLLNQVRAQAANELVEETKEKALKLYKEKLKEIQTAEVVLANLKRELADLEQRIEHGNI